MLSNLLAIFVKIPVLKRLIPSLIKKISSVINLQIKVKRNNALFLLNTKNQHDRALLLSPDYEPKQINFLLNEINTQNNFNIFIDIGACIGFYSLSVASMCPNISRVDLFEPNNENFLCAKRNIELNNETAIKSSLYNFGLSNKSASKKLYTLKKNDGAGGSIPEFEGQYADKGAVSFDIEVKIGDEILRYENKKIVLKIDVERHELNVLEGIKNLLTKNKCLVQVEVFGEYFDSISSIMKDYGYREFHRIDHNYLFDVSDFYYKNY
tara:strand:+ start:272 stop:1072 length:801 start_codon:yes stop_codon:yes gene_type:complete